MPRIYLDWSDQPGFETSFRPGFDSSPTTTEGRNLVLLFQKVGYLHHTDTLWFTREADGREKLIAALKASGWTVSG